MKKTIDEVLQDVNARKSAQIRMAKYTNKTTINKCWEWQGHCNDKGYAMLSIGGRSGKYARTSRLVYYFNFGPFNEELIVCHKCDNPKCVNPNHLFLGTNQDNTDDMYNKGRESAPPNFYGEEIANSKLTEEEVINIYNSSISMKDLAQQYNVTVTTIHRILTGKSWQHLNLKPKFFKRFVPTPKKKLSEDDVRYIRNSKKRNVDLAKQFNCDASHIGKIKKFKARTEVN